MNACPHCQTQNRDTAQFCQNCGTTMSTEVHCPDCGTQNPAQARFCLNCAAPLRGGTPPRGLTGMLPPDTLLADRYRIVRKLGRGGMGAVYLVNDTRLGDKPWACKELSTAALVSEVEKQDAIAAFQHEANLLASLNHPNLTRVMDYFEDGGKHYLVMDYIEGQTLDELLEGRSEPFPEAQITDWAHQLCGVLEYLHNQPQPIIFRDLKPGNIMVDNNDQVQLIDFGIARLFKPGKNRDTASFGTTGYAPPEQYGRGQTDPRSDIYALGATLHHLVTLRDPGDEPFKFPAPNTINPALSSELNDAITKAVAQEPDRRWSSAANFARALDTAQAVSVQPVIQTQVSAAVVTQPVSHKVHPAPEPEVTPKSERQKRLPQRGILIAGGIILALLITFGALYLLDVLPASSTTGAAFPGIRSFEYTYTSNRDGKREVYRLDENGEVVRITNSPGSAESWSPTTSSGGSLLFTSTRAGKREVFRLDKSGDTARVTNTPGGAESWSPSISARGRTLFTSNRDGKREIYRIDENGEVARVTHTPADAESWSPTLSPSGNLLFTSNRDGKRDIYRIDENGEVARVTHTPGDGESWSATLSPQGKILFTSNRDGKREIYRMDEDGDIARVTHTPADAESWAPIRTPAGSILFTSNRGGKAEIYRLEPSGDVVRVTNTPAHAESWTGQDE